MPSALTMWAASRVPVYLDTTEMESLVPVYKRVAISLLKKLLHKTSYLITTCKTSNSAFAQKPRCNVEAQKQRTLFMFGSLKSS